MKKVVLGVVSIFVLLSVSFFGFAGGQGEPESITGEVITLEVWVLSGHLSQQWNQYIYQKWETEKPEIKLNFLEIPEDEYERKYYMSLQAKKAPDLISFWGETFGDYVHSGAVAPMPDDLRTAFWDSGVYPEFRKIFDFDGKTYALNDNIGPYIMHFNKTMFSEAGLSNPPNTWDDFIDAAKKTTKYNEQGDVERVGYAIRHVGHIPGSVGKWLPFLFSAGGAFMDEDGQKVLFNDGAGRKALGLYVDLIHKHKASSLEFPDPRNAFIDELAAMQVSENIERRLEKEAPDLDFGFALIPAAAGSESETVFDCNLFGVSPQSNHQREAWEHLIWLHEASRIKERILMAKDVVPLRPATANDPAVTQLEFVRIALVALEGANPYPVAPNFREVCGIFWDYAQRALYAKMSVADALVEAERDANEALARAR